MRLGVLGGGQLGRMLALAAHPLGVRTRCFDPAPDAPAGQVCELAVGSFEDRSALARFAEGLDAVTYEFENVPAEAAAFLSSVAPTFPSPQALATAQDRLLEKSFFRSLGIPTPAFAAVETAEQVREALASVGTPAVLKTRRMGYDGKGQAVIASASEAGAAFAALAGGAASAPLILEAFVPFDRELSVLAVRGRDGAWACWPLVQNVHRRGILRTSIAPAPGAGSAQAQATDYIGRALSALGYVGVLALECFEVGGALLASEMACRVHNSGHWTIEGSVTSQFENHVRAALGLPLGSCAMSRGVAGMVNLIGEAPDAAALARLLAIEDAHVHLYGKPARKGRKLGHVTALAPDPATLERRLVQIAGAFPPAASDGPAQTP